MAVRLLIAAALFLASAASAHAELVKLDPAQPERSAGLARAAGGTALAPEIGIWRVPHSAVGRLRRAGVIQVSRREAVLTPASAARATDPFVSLQWWRPVIGADAVDPPGPGVPVTVVDSGLDVTHPEFAGRPNTQLLNRQSTVERDEDHGTEVSSVVAAPNNGIGVVGVYPDAQLRVWDASPYGALLEGSAIQGIREAAIRGPGVINLSFGGDEDDPLLRDAVMFAVRSGSLVVAAAGNGGSEGSPLEYPAAYPHVLSVGATNESGNVAAFSTIGPTVDLVAPGVRIYVAEPLSFPSSSGYDFAPGTSFSAPMVAGAAAWVWTVRPDLDNTQLFELMRRSARDIGRPGFDITSGYGLLDIPAALAFRTPAGDPLEPNEQPVEIEPKRLFTDGMSPLTRPGHLTTSLRAHVDRNEDPLDLYRMWAPPSTTVRVQALGSVVLRILQRSTTPEKKAPLAIGKRGSVSYRNPDKTGGFVYLEVRPANGTREAQYNLSLTAARR